jgi:hypothetical protein
VVSCPVRQVSPGRLDDPDENAYIGRQKISSRPEYSVRHERFACMDLPKTECGRGRIFRKEPFGIFVSNGRRNEKYS